MNYIDCKKVPPRNKWLILVVVSIGTLMTTLDSGIVSVSFPALADAFHTDSSTVLWVNVAYWVTDVGLLLTVGWMGDIAGRRRVFTLGFLVFTMGVLLSAGSMNIWQLIGARVVQAVGTAMLLANTYAIITDVFPTHERGKAIGVSIAVVGIGLSSGPFMGGVLLDTLDWRALFYSRAPLGLMGAFLSWVILPRDKKMEGKYKVDYIGAAALFAAMATALLVINQGGRIGFGTAPVVGLAISALVVTPVVVWAQRRSPRPILDFSLFRIPPYIIGLAISVSHYLAHGGIMLVAPFFLLEARGFSATRMGFYIAAFYVMRTVLGPFTGRLTDRIGPRIPLLTGNLVIMAGLLWLSLLTSHSSNVVILVSLLLAGAGSAIFEPAVTSAIMGAVPRDRLGTASASVATGRHIAFAVGVALAGAIFTIRERVYLPLHVASGLDLGISKRYAVADAFSDVLTAGVVLSAIAAVLALSLPKVKSIVSSGTKQDLGDNPSS